MRSLKHDYAITKWKTKKMSGGSPIRNQHFRNNMLLARTDWTVMVHSPRHGHLIWSKGQFLLALVTARTSILLLWNNHVKCIQVEGEDVIGDNDEEESLVWRMWWRSNEKSRDFRFVFLLTSNERMKKWLNVIQRRVSDPVSSCVHFLLLLVLSIISFIWTSSRRIVRRLDDDVRSDWLLNQLSEWVGLVKESSSV